MSFYRHGDPCARSLTEAELKVVRGYVTDALADYWKTEQVRLALQLTEELMNFQPRYAFGYELEMRAAMEYLKDSGAKARDVLRRVLEVYAVIERAPSSRFQTPRSIHHALARCTLRLVSLGRWRSKGRLLDFLGQQIAENLGVFSIAFLRHIEKKHTKRRELIAKTAAFDEVKV